MKSKELKSPQKNKPETNPSKIVTDEQLKAVGIKWWSENKGDAGCVGYFIWENRTLFKKFVSLPFEDLALEKARDYAVEMYCKFDVVWAK